MSLFHTHALSIDEALKTRKVIITCGTGGVGKTTLSASLAIRAAFLGRKVVVITIDPAKRLVTSLGLKSLGDEAHPLTAALPNCKGELWALMPDTRSTLETFFRSLAPTSELGDRIVGNTIFQVLAKEFSGANEYMALSKLNSTFQENRYDLIILDTPPNRNTIAFFTAPRLLQRFFEEPLIRKVVMPGNRVLGAAMKTAVGLLERLTGGTFVSELMQFLSDLLASESKFTQTIAQMNTLLQSPDTGFLLVSAPSPESFPEAKHFVETVQKKNLRLQGLILNRTLSALQITEQDLSQPELRPALQIIEAQQAREKKVIAAMEAELGTCLQLPELTRDVHSLADLIHIAKSLGPIAH